MRIIGISGLTCSGKSTALQLFKIQGWQTVDIGEIIRDTYSLINAKEDIFKFTIDTHNSFGKNWSLIKALDHLVLNENSKIAISGIRYKEQVDIIRKLDKCNNHIYINSDKDIRLDRFYRRRRDDTGPSLLDFEAKEAIELDNYDLEKVYQLSKVKISNNASLLDFKNLLNKIIEQEN